MRRFGLGLAVALAAAAAACSQASSDNVMAPEANALDPADVDAALGPEDAAVPDSNQTANEVNAEAETADEPAANASSDQEPDQ